MQQNSAFDGALSALPDYIIKLIVADIPFNILTLICRQFGVFILSELKLLFPNIKNNKLLHTKYAFNSLDNLYLIDDFIYKIIDNRNSFSADYIIELNSTKYYIYVRLWSCENKIRGASMHAFDHNSNVVGRSWCYKNKNNYLVDKSLCQYIDIDIWVRNNKHISSEGTLDNNYQKKLYNKILNLVVDTIYANKLIVV